MDASDGRLWSEARGDVGLEGKVLVIRRIQVTYHLEAEEERREVVERVLEKHAHHCPVARTLEGCVDISTELVLEAPD